MNKSVKYAKKITNRQLSNNELKQIKQMTTIGQIAKFVLNENEYQSWLIENGKNWYGFAPGKVEYWKAVKNYLSQFANS